MKVLLFTLLALASTFRVKQWTHAVLGTSSLSASPKLSLGKVTAEMSPLALRKVQKSDLYKHAWPTNCNGENSKGKEIHVSTNHFLCDEKTNKIPELMGIGWRNEERSTSCCNSECGHWKRCGEQQYTYTFEEAARVALSTAALNADHIVTAGGSNVQINVKQGAGAVRAVVEVRMMDGHLTFETSEVKLTREGAAFLSDLSTSLGPLISMQVSAFDTPTNVKICPHAETSSTLDYMEKHGFEGFPKARADMLKAELQKFVPEEVASFGEGIGHFRGEIEGYNAEGKKRAFIIYKLYDVDSEAPPCEWEDLHNFADIVDRA